MQIAIVRTSIFDQQVLPVLKQQAAINRQCLGDYIRVVLYRGFGYEPRSSNNSAHRMLENMTNKNSGGNKTLFVGVDQTFYYHFNIPGNMKAVNKILYEAAGCGHLYR